MALSRDKLKGKIKEICGTQDRFGSLMGMSHTTVTAKLNGNSDFTQSEIIKAAEILKINDNDIVSYFFAGKVQKS